MSVQTVARRYASALADVVVKNKEAEEVKEELTAWNDMMKSNSLLDDALKNPTIAHKQKSNVLESLIGKTKVRRTTANFLRVLLRNQRISELGEINKRFEQELDERSGFIAAQITTARPVSQGEQAALQAKLTTMTGKKVRLSFETKEDLIGGVVTRIGSTLYDGSIQNQLNQLKEKLSS